MKPSLVVVLLIHSVLYYEVTPNPLISLEDVENFSTKLLQLYKNINPDSDLIATYRKLFSELNTLLSIDLPKIGINYEERLNIFDLNMTEDTQKYVQIDLDGFHERSSVINELVKTYLIFLKGKFTPNTVPDFTNKVLSSSESENANINAKKIFEIICPGKLVKFNIEQRKCIFNQMSDRLNLSVKRRRQYDQNLQQLIYKTFNDIATVEMRAFLITTTGYKLKSLQINVDHSDSITLVKNKHLERMKNYLIGAHEAIPKATTEITRDPEIIVEYMTNGILAMNLLLKESDYKNNWVVTGTRFVVKDSVIHLQIEEGKLRPGEKIMSKSQKWIPIDAMEYNSNGTLTLATNSNEIIQLRDGVDYYTFGEWDYIGEENFRVPENHVITGASLRYKTTTYPIGYLNKTWIYIKLRSAPVDFFTGQIKADLIVENNNDTNPPLHTYRRLTQFTKPEERDEVYANLDFH